MFVKSFYSIDKYPENAMSEIEICINNYISNEMCSIISVSHSSTQFYTLDSFDEKPERKFMVTAIVVFHRDNIINNEFIFSP